MFSDVDDSCRDGTSKPPAASKKRIDATCVGDEPEARPSKASTKPAGKGGSKYARNNFFKSKQKTKEKQSEKPDARLQQLEDLHGSTNVRERLNIPEGRRIKVGETNRGNLAARQDVKHKQKSVPNFDIRFTDLTNGKPEAENDDMDSFSSSDDLPGMAELLASRNVNHKKRKEPSSETHYSDSVIDAAILDMPLSGSLPASSPIVNPSSQLFASSPSHSSSRRHVDTPLRKRVRVATSSPVISIPSSPVEEVCTQLSNNSWTDLSRFQREQEK